MIVLNDVSDGRIGFNSEDNAVTVITRTTEERLDLAAKSAISRALIQRIASAFDATHAATRTIEQNGG